MKIVINNDYVSLEDFIKSVPEVFNDTHFGQIIRKGRNILKKVDCNGYSVVIKKFVKITYANKIIYSFFRKNKAQRSYEYAFGLKRLGVDTPSPIAYISVKRYGIIKESYYISQYSDYKTVDSLLNSSDLDCNNQVVYEYAKFISSLHEKKILHKDLNPANVLYKKCSNSNKILFQLVDLNRMKFDFRFGKWDRAKNLLRVSNNKNWDYFIIFSYEKILGFSRSSILKLWLFLKGGAK